MSGRPARLAALLAALLLVTACDASDGRLPPTGDGESNPASATQIAARDVGSLAWIPQDALLVARCPDLGELDVLGKTAFARLLEPFDLDAEASLAPLLERALKEFPLLRDAWDIFSALEGEATLALHEVYPSTFRRPSRNSVPFSGVAWIELGALEERVVAFMGEVSEAARDYRGFERVDERHLCLTEDGARMSFIVDRGWLCIHVGPQNLDADPIAWRSLARSESFAGTPVACQSPGAEPGETVYLEGHVNLRPVWPLVLAASPPEAKQIMRAMHLDAIQGLSLVAGVDASSRFHDRFVFHSPSRKDVVSRIFAQPALDPQMASRIAPEADGAFLFNFDLERTLAAVRELLPPRQRNLMDSSVRRFGRQLGVDLGKTAHAGFGPGFVVSMSGDPFAEAGSPEAFQATAVIDVADVAKARKMMDLLMRRLDPGAARLVSTDGPGLRSLPFSDGPSWFKPSWDFAGKTLVIGTSPQAVRAITRAEGQGPLAESVAETLRGAASGSWGHAQRSTVSEVRMLYGLARMLVEQSGLGALGRFGMMGGIRRTKLPTWASLEEIARDLPPSETSCRHTEAGVILEGRTVLPSLLVGAAPVAMVAAVALPNLLSARLSANESAAIATLRNLCSAQAQFQAMAAADRDDDGVGEYGFFGELCGKTELPGGERLMPPVLSSAFRQTTQGCVVRNGYVFRIHLSDGGREVARSRPDGGAPEALSADLAESGFVVYAWPRDFGETGKRAFMVDSAGDVLATTNELPSQRYSGFERIPGHHAARAKSTEGRGPTRSRDGGFWAPVR